MDQPSEQHDAEAEAAEPVDVEAELDQAIRDTLKASGLRREWVSEARMQAGAVEVLERRGGRLYVRGEVA